MAYPFQVTIDSVDPHALASWWATTLGWRTEPSDEAFIRRMIEEGLATDADTTHYEGVLVWRAGAAVRAPTEDPFAPRVLFQLVPEPKSGKNRVHLDVRSGEDDLEHVVAGLIERGARELHRGQQGPYRWVTMADPEGNEFCVG